MTERIRLLVRRSLGTTLAAIFAVVWIIRAGGLPGDGQARAADPQPKAAPVPVAAPAQAAPIQLAAPAQAVPAQVAPVPLKAVPLRGRFVQLQPGQIINRAGRQPGSDASDDTLEGVFGPPDRETLKHLDRAKQLSQDGRFSESLQLLDDILESSQDYFFRPEDSPSSQRGLKAEARRLISSQPTEGLKAYELLFGAKAQRMLDDALKAGDINAVAEVARRYFNTQAGYQATLLLGRYNLDHNQPLAAGLCFQRLQETQTAAERFEPSLSILLAVSWARGGMNARAEEVLLQLKKRDPRAMIRFAGRPVPLFTESVQALAWLATNVGHQQAQSDAAATNWALFRGNPARNASSAGGTPLLNPRWRVPTTEHQAAERAVMTARQENLDRNIPILPVMQPLAVGDVVLMRTARSLLAVDFTTGKRIWEVRSQADLQSDRVATSGARIAAMQGAVGDPSLSEKLWENATTGTLASDGLYIYAVEDPANVAAGPNEPARFVVRPNGAVRVTGDRPTNELASYELRTQGKLQWKVGGDKRDSDIVVEPKLSGAYFLGPPLPLMGSLYAMAEIKGEIRLVVLDAKTGKLQWQQQLAYVEQNALQDTYRRLAGASPSYADGVLICPTAAGAVVAVDLANRSLLWGFEYPHNQQMPQQQMMAIRMGMAVANYGMQSYLGDRWADATATLADGQVVLTPIESDQLFCLNLIDGKLLWKQDRGENVYVGCVQNGKALLVGRRQVQAVNLADGKPGWAHPLELPVGGMPSGRGFLSDGSYYLPLSSAEVVKIDLAAGSIAGRAKSRKGNIPGNLICYKGDVVSQGVDSLDTFYQLEPLRQRIAAVLADHPDDPWALARRGEIALDEGRLTDAIADTRRSFDKDPNPFTRELLVEGMLAALGKDFKAAHDQIGELEKLLALDSERAAFLRLMAEGLQKQDDRLGSLDAYLQLVDLQWGQGDPESVDPNLSVRRDRWVQARFDELYAAATSEERAKIDAAIATRLKTALDAKSAKPLRRFLSYFASHPAADEARERLVQMSNLPDTLLEREGLLRQLAQSKDPVRQRGAVAQMASLLASAARPDEAAVYYHQLATDFADAVCFGGKTGKQLVAELPAESPEVRALAESSAWPGGRVKREASGPHNLRGMNYQRPQVLDWHGDRGVFATTTVLFDQQQQQVVGRDGLGREQFRIPLAESGQQNRMGFIQPSAPNLSFAAAREHLLLVDLGNQVLAMDTLRSAGSGSRVLWQQELLDMPPNMFNVTPVQSRAISIPFAAPRYLPAVGPGGPVIGVVGPFTSHGLCIARARDLTMLDPLSGSTLWVRHGLVPGSDVFGDDEVLIVAPPDGSAAQVVRTCDGQLLGNRTLPAVDARWAYCGRRVLGWVQTPQGKIKLTLSDPWKNSDQILGEFSAGSKGTLVGTDAAAMLEPGGRFVTMSLRDGRKIIDEQLEPEPMLHDIVVQASPEQVLLVANRPSRHPNQNNRVVAPALMADPSSPLISGHVYAFDAATGKPQWPAPAIVETHYALLGQGQELPVILFLRPTQVRSIQGSGEIKSSVLFLDRRNGRAVHEEELAQPLNNLNFELTGDRKAKTVALMLPNQTVTLQYTDDPLPPEPPYQAGLALRQSRLGTTAAGAVLRALGGAARDMQDDDPLDDDDASK